MISHDDLDRYTDHDGPVYSPSVAEAASDTLDNMLGELARFSRAMQPLIADAREISETRVVAQAMSYGDLAELMALLTEYLREAFIDTFAAAEEHLGQAPLFAPHLPPAAPADQHVPDISATARGYCVRYRGETHTFTTLSGAARFAAKLATIA